MRLVLGFFVILGIVRFLAVEIDYLHPDYKNDEDKAVAQSVKNLKKIAASLK